MSTPGGAGRCIFRRGLAVVDVYRSRNARFCRVVAAVSRQLFSRQGAGRDASVLHIQQQSGLTATAASLFHRRAVNSRQLCFVVYVKKLLQVDHVP